MRGGPTALITRPAVTAATKVLTGAYAASMASNYNLVPRAAAVMVEDGRSEPLVRRETVPELLARDV